ncbi:adenosine receptor A3-like [Actinia tenebrosa]|uniref:Adenosine receptor A3-like n=1 Tax=Actinia tenebrosa TaxID=6105 RepID=A0A6P8I2D1_ACTTE|nr:adenosine receptor A3-like [Actinia tenebrosa]
MESLNNSDVLEEFEDESYMSASEIILWSTIFIIEAIFIILGNLLTMLTFLNFKLRKNKPFFFLLNLSFADFVVGAFSIPLFVHVFISYFTGTHTNEGVYLSHRSLEAFTQFIAIFSLALVSLERMYAVVWPIRHRRAKIRSYMICIAFTWVLAAAVPCLSHIPLQSIQTLSFYLYFIFHSAALVLICIAYIMVWMWVTCNRPRVISRQHELDRKLARTLVLVTVVSLIAWIPFQLIYYIGNLCKTCAFIPNTPLYFSKMLHYGNSLVNPVVYCFRIPEFYKKTLRILHLRKPPAIVQTNDSIELRRRHDVNASPLKNSIVTYREEYPFSRDMKSMDSCCDV